MVTQSSGSSGGHTPVISTGQHKMAKCCKVIPGGRNLPYQQAQSHLVEKTLQPRQNKAMHIMSTNYTINASIVDDITMGMVEHLRLMLTEIMQAVNSSHSSSQTQDNGK